MSEPDSHVKLTLDRLDSISLDLLGGRQPDTQDLIATELIPFMEWTWLRAAGHRLAAPDVASSLFRLRAALRTNAEVWGSEMPGTAGFIRVRRKHVDLDYTNWIWFRRRFEAAMETGGFSVALAKQITGAMGELEDNIHWHSELARSGLLAFLANDKCFEFVVLDRGIGVLASLRHAEEFHSLGDDGAALEIAVSEGQSRFGEGSRRGYGFHDLFLGLANNKSHIRFRSGDHLLQLDGASGGKMTAKRAQRARGRGFLIGVRCTL